MGAANKAAPIIFIISIMDISNRTRLHYSGTPVFELVCATVHRTVAFNLFESDYLYKRKKHPNWGAFFVGAGNRTRTGTLFTARDFKSLVSTDFTMPAWLLRNDSTLFPFRQVMEQKNRITAGQCSMQRQANNAPGTNPAPDGPFLS